jgi:hypothetical protein
MNDFFHETLQRYPGSFNRLVKEWVGPLAWGTMPPLYLLVFFSDLLSGLAYGRAARTEWEEDLLSRLGFLAAWHTTSCLPRSKTGNGKFESSRALLACSSTNEQNDRDMFDF